ncbi:hypothetical protein [Rufibacter hautae]|uniref:Uncharacterized protein n=1 Tax=Rufibacter hautae TaxID=2595005 RepID=A0A5B6TC44_9BACT|nr:hypothetical protein [Rufibacter hautae]KAA3438039.1 hypothetical protein FOA19_12250 [Rufibacter hautae]
MERYAKEQVSKEVLEVILDHYAPKLTSKGFSLFGINITYYFPEEDLEGKESNLVAFSIEEDTRNSYFILATQGTPAPQVKALVEQLEYDEPAAE